jgi:NAD(P)-dependent dehydrogenase (short-subunit alcohol dehydrogenase family)
MRRFDEKTVVVTGASGGIGGAIVEGFLDEGATVVALGSSRQKLSAFAERLQSDRLETVALDLRDVPGIARCVADLTEPPARIDVLVNCAGVAFQTPILDISVDQWNETIAINLSAAFFMSQLIARHMVERGGGAIVNVSSVDAFIAESTYADYNASKAGLSQLTTSMAFELGHLGIRCNAIAPGFTMTPMMDFTDDRATYENYMSVIPVRRYAEPREQASVVLFLASDAASYVNGVTIRVDGGMLHGFWADPTLAPPARQD